MILSPASCSLATLLDERLHEVLGVALEDVVDLVEDRVDVLVELLLALGDVGLRQLLDRCKTADQLFEALTRG